jgi:hypothetical protein
MRGARLCALTAVLLLPASAGTLAVDFALLYTYVGNDTLDKCGQALACGGDLDGDGWGDVAVWVNDTPTSPADGGVVCVYSGRTGAEVFHAQGSQQGDVYGWRGTVFVPDVDGDGCDELAVSHVKDATFGSQSGRVDLWSGKTHQKIRSFYGETSGDTFGSALALAGDVDADGTADVLVGSLYYRKDGQTVGLARVHSGADGSVLLSVTGQPGQSFGCAVAGAGDVDGDGHDDILVGAYYDSTPGYLAGAARVYSGRDGEILHLFTGDDADDYFGAAVAGIGDVDGDGCGDVAIAAFYDEAAGEKSGSVYVYSGRTGDLVVKLSGDAPSDSFGYALAALGDIDLDGCPDLVVGARGTGGPGSGPGMVKVFSGADWSVLDVLYGENGGDIFGSAVAAGGDVNADGIPDFVVGAPSFAAGGVIQAGRAYVYTSYVPQGFFAIDGGAPCTGSTEVVLQAIRPDGTWTEMRARNEGGAFTDWMEFAPRTSFTLLPGEGEKTVEVEMRDTGGIVLGSISDSIWLDQTPPEGTVVIDGGRGFTRQTNVTLALSATDNRAGPGAYRVRNLPQAFSVWRAFVESRSWIVGPTDGLYTVEVQYRDLVGNVASACTAAVTLDTVAPVGSFALDLGRDYVFWDEAIRLSVSATDAAPASGLDGLQLSLDDGSQWGAWLPFTAPGLVEVARPPVQGTRVLRARVRDRATNSREIGSAKAVFLGPDLPLLLPVGKRAGLLAPEVRAQVFRVGLVAGDLFGVRLKVNSSEGDVPALTFDLLGPDRSVLVAGGFPAGAKGPGITGFPVPETGEHFLVLRSPLEGSGPGGTFLLSLSTKQAKANRGGSGTVEGEAVVFDAVAGSMFKASLAREGLTAAQVTLSGPSGPLSFTAKEGNGKVAILPVALDQPTGTWRLEVAGPGAVKVKYAVKLPK